MPVGDTLKWALPEEPPPGTVVEALGAQDGLKWQRDSWTSDFGSWIQFLEGPRSVPAAFHWSFILYFHGGSVAVVSGDQAGTELSWTLPDEPPVGSVVSTDSGTRYMRRKGSRPIDHLAWRMVDESDRLINEWMHTTAKHWAGLVFEADGSLTLVKLGN
ncbi:MAG: hypothetical protein ABIN01_21275 [Ferruginibacter sp.]